jgi:hypothetical protein
MTTAPGQHPPQPGPAAGARQHLAAIAGRLASHGLASRLTVLEGTPVLDISQPDGGPDLAAVAIDPGPGPQLDCTCTWTPAPGADAATIASTIRAVLDAIGAAGQAPAGITRPPTTGGPS